MPSSISEGARRYLMTQRFPAQVHPAVDDVAGGLIDAHRAQGYGVVVVSEYGITEVSGAVTLNRTLREAGFP